MPWRRTALHRLPRPAHRSVRRRRRPMRPLTLHASALNDDEYALFTSSLADLVAPDPAPTEHEKPLISTREVRAWLRGRYAELPLSELDAVRTCSYSGGLVGLLNRSVDLAILCTTSRPGSCAQRWTVLCYPSARDSRSERRCGRPQHGVHSG